ncbi:MAG: GtrA family protein [Erythrobacter sp.]
MRRLLAPHTLTGRFVRYGVASASGTVVDLAAFGLMLAGGVGAGLAAVCGYTLGTLWHWQVSRRFVFADRLARHKGGRGRQQSLFFASALLGVILTYCIVELGTQTGFAPTPAKIAAMCAAFTSVWLVRLLFVFAEDWI